MLVVSDEFLPPTKLALLIFFIYIDIDIDMFLCISKAYYNTRENVIFKIIPFLIPRFESSTFFYGYHKSYRGVSGTLKFIVLVRQDIRFYLFIYYS